MKLVAYFDESGIPAHCNVLVLACVWRIVPKGASYYQIGRSTALRLARLLGMERSRELKYTAARRRRDRLPLAIDVIKREFNVAYAYLHVKQPSQARVLLAAKLLEDVVRQAPSGLKSMVLVFDEAPIKLPALRLALKNAARSFNLEVKMKSSVKVKGLQLADLIAGYVRERILEQCGDSMKKL